jgi:hypothetical protein
VFKKRPNLLNSAPTNQESALLLLSAPSVRFCQQTAICPVSLWAVVVELHPLNWARAQAVYRIRENVTMTELEERARARARVCMCVCVCVCEWVKFCCKLGKHFAETFQLLNQAYGEDCMSRTQWCEWFKRFNQYRISVGDDPWPGQIPHQQTTTMSRQFVLCFVEIVV